MEENDNRIIGKMSTDYLVFNLSILADLEEIQAEEAGDYTTEGAHRYRAAIIREAAKRLGKN